ncbi:ParB/RepB/Spo0J family partition protein [Comamonas sp.]|uniref:ParB/RepB/Spo0J family partition protein n=1 Tax=Comamonas sp. TaxID=34028 RepID=UPI002FCBD407
MAKPPIPQDVAPDVAPAPETTSDLQTQPPTAVLPATNHDTPPEVVLLLDPSVIDPGTAPNRTADAMDDEAMEALSLSVFLSKGNQQPIHVRLLEQAQDGYQYALISGARRLQACMRQHLQVRALVVDVTPEKALVERLIENHLREPLSPWELGQQLAHIKAQASSDLSMRKLASLIGINASQVQKALDIAALPHEVVEAFTSPKDIRYADSKVLKDWVATSADAVIEKATQIKGQALPAKQVLEQLGQAAQNTPLKETAVEPFNTLLQAPLKVQGSVVGEVRADKTGQLLIALQTPMSLLQQQALAQCVEQFIARKVLRIKPGKNEVAAVEVLPNTTEAANDKSVESATTGSFGNEGAKA